VTQDVREIRFRPRSGCCAPIIAVDDVSVGYDPKQPVLNRVTLRIDTDDRIALLGSNGNGKSTWSSYWRASCRRFPATSTRAEKTLGRLFGAASVDELNSTARPTTTSAS